MSWTEADRVLRYFIAEGHQPDGIYLDSESGEAVGTVIGTASAVRLKATELDAADSAGLSEIAASRYVSEPMNTYQEGSAFHRACREGLFSEVDATCKLLARELMDWRNDKTGETWRPSEALKTLVSLSDRRTRAAVERLENGGIIKEVRPAHRGVSRVFRFTKSTLDAIKPHMANRKGGRISPPSEERRTETTERRTETVAKADVLVHPYEEIQRDKKAAARGESHFEEAELCAVCGIPANTVHTTPSGIEYTEAEYLAWCQDKTVQRRGHSGLTKKIHNEDRGEYEAWRDRNSERSKDFAATVHRDRDIAACGDCDENGWKDLDDNTRAPCRHGKAATEAEAEPRGRRSRDGSDLTALADIQGIA